MCARHWTNNSINLFETARGKCARTIQVPLRFLYLGEVDKVRQKIDYTGHRFGRLVVMEYVGKYKNGDRIVKCSCDCGNEISVRLPHIKSGAIVSCGCFHKETVVERNKKYTTATHGETNTRLHSIWTNMKQRCYNKNHKSYHNYGGRGIAVCDEWLDDFVAFRDWAMANGYRDDLTIDRIENDKGYSPDNCRWATMLEQAQNKRPRKTN